MRLLHEFFPAPAGAAVRRVAVEDPDGRQLTYGELDELAGRLCARLRALGVQAGDRVGVFLPKSGDAVAVILGTLRAGAAYVPVDPSGPMVRNAAILSDCAPRAIVVDGRLAGPLRAQLATPVPELIVVDDAGGGRGLGAALASTAPDPGLERVGADDLACILYTSGSTGRPKGVMLSHRNVAVFVDWCTRLLDTGPQDRFSAHAPFHFDLSTFDIFGSLGSGATLVVIPEALAGEPVGLAARIAERRLTIWYSVPSALALLARFGHLERHPYGALRAVLFAGEVFPIAPLRLLRDRLPAPRFFNLYGPTETNVCTFHELPPAIEADRTHPFPIGRPCPHFQATIADDELCVRGPGVMLGYWNQPEQTAARFLVDAAGERWFRTGDLVRRDAAGDYEFLGRRDRMIKRSGHRIELGEIEAALHAHPEIVDAAVVAVPDDMRGVQVTAFLVARGDRPPSAIALRGFCAGRLPTWMIADAFAPVASLPRTSTGKIDYPDLERQAATRRPRDGG